MIYGISLTNGETLPIEADYYDVSMGMVKFFKMNKTLPTHIFNFDHVLFIAEQNQEESQ